MFTELDAINRLTIRRSCYWKQNTQANDKGKYGYSHIKKPLTDDDIFKSINTNIFTIGTATTQNGTNQSVAPAIDIDAHDGEDILPIINRINEEAIKQGYNPIIEASSGDDITKGCHLIFPCKPTQSAFIRAALRGLLIACGLDYNKFEIFPKQDTVSEDGYGNFVKTIFQYNNRTGKRGTIINPETMKPFERQDAINHIMACPDNVFPEIQGIETPIVPMKEATTATTEPIKSDIANESTHEDFDKEFEGCGNVKGILPCVKMAFNKDISFHNRGSEGHDGRLFVAGNMLDNGFDIEFVHEYFKGQPDYSRKRSEKQIKSIKEWIEKGNRPMGCYKAKEKCVGLLDEIGACGECKKNNQKERKRKERPSDEVKETLDNGFGSYHNNMELVEEYQKVAPTLYDISKNYYLYIEKLGYYKRIDDIDILSAIRRISKEYVIEATIAGEIKRAIQITGRERLSLTKPIKETWIHTLSGIVDYKTGEKLQASPEYFLTCPIPHCVGTSDNTPTIDKIFNDWIGERKQILYEILAYCLVDSYPIHRMFILFGSGRNGKSQFLELLTRFIGIENTTSTELEKIIESRFECSKLHRKKAALIGETNFTAIKSSDRIKKITGHDMLTAEFKGKDPFDFTNTAKILIATNSIPETLDKTEAFHSRCVIIEFKNRFNEGKPIIDSIPEIEYENLLYKCLKLLPGLIGMGKFTNEGTIEEKAIKYEKLSNPFPTFKDKELVEDGAEQTPVWIIRDMYISFCAKNGFRKIGERDFTQLLSREGFETKRAWYGKKNWNTVYGLSPKIPYVYNSDSGAVDVVHETAKQNQIEPDKPHVQIGSSIRALSETSGSSGSIWFKPELMNSAYQLIHSHYGSSQPISSMGIESEADNLKAKFNISKEDALLYVREVVNARNKGI